MSEVIANDAEAARVAAGALRRFGETWQRIHARLSGASEAAGECWGDDAGGKSFAAAYADAHRELLAALANSGRVGDGSSGHAQQTGAGVSETDESTAEVAGRFARG